MAEAFAVAAGLDRIVAIRRRLNYKEKVEKATNAAVRETDRFGLTLASGLKEMAKDSRGVTLGEKDLRQPIENLAAETGSPDIKIEEVLGRVKILRRKWRGSMPSGRRRARSSPREKIISPLSGGISIDSPVL